MPGWYEFHHVFRDAGALAVDLTIRDSVGTEINSWMLSNPADTIPGVVAGNRYGWFSQLDVEIAVDSTQLEVSAITE